MRHAGAGPHRPGPAACRTFVHLTGRDEWGSMLVPVAAGTPARGAAVPRSIACALIVRKMPSCYGITIGRPQGDTVRPTPVSADPSQLRRGTLRLRRGALRLRLSTLRRGAHRRGPHRSGAR